LSGNAVDSISFTVRLTTNGFFGPFKNSIVGFASNSASVAVKDSSNAGLDPDSDGDLNPNNNSVPTTFTLAPKLFFGITKMGEVSSKLDNNTFNISYSITVHNLGNDTLYNVVLKDSLFEKTIKAPANYIIKTAPVANGNLAANPLFDGKTDINLLDPLNSKMPPGFVNTITFMINVNPDTVSTISNSAYGNAIGSNNKLVSDTSNAGSNPDSNGNGIWNEPADNIPTVLTISNHTLFIPQGFTPNGDGKNDLFVIKGLPSPGENAFTVFNRWGNKVYFSSNYENTWDGQPNVVGALGNNKLPQGTYFYILDMKGSGIKPITGFIVVQY
jgi:gliding motility-associated-like protein